MLWSQRLGAIGLPVFADQSGGIAVLLGPTGSYLFGFLLGAHITGHLSRSWLNGPRQRTLARLGLAALTSLLLLAWSRAESQAFIARLACGILGVLIIYIPGTIVLHLVTGIPIQTVTTYGALQFIGTTPGDPRLQSWGGIGQ